jgi:lysozyme
MDDTRRRLVGRLAVLAAMPLAGCGTSPQFRRSWATLASVADPVAVGLNAVVDISHSNRVTDFAAARGQGNVLAVIHKATEGYDWADPRYTERRIAAEAAGLLWGAYHFGTYERPGAEQASHYLAVAQPGPETLMALDLELNERNPANSMDISRAEDFVLTILTATGRLPMLYIHPAWADGEAVGGRTRTLGGAIRAGSVLAQCDLWLADYRVRPELPTAWSGRGGHLWQYTGDEEKSGGPFRAYARAVAGIERCDRSVFIADSDRLHRYWRYEAGRQAKLPRPI